MDGAGDDEPIVFDEDFVRAAPVREDEWRDGRTPSRASLREVKREARRRRRAARQGRRNAVVAIVVTLALLGGLGVAFRAAARRARARPVAATAAPTTTPSASAPAPLGDPYAGTVFDSWPVRGAGLVAPPARPVGAYPAAHVKHAYARTAAFLRAAVLDDRVLYDGGYAPVAATLRPDSASRWRPGTNKHGTAIVATRFRGVAPATRATRVRGRMTARLGPGGELHVAYRYLAAYALRPAGRPDAKPELVVIRRVGTLAFAARDATRVGLPWFYVGTYTSDHSRCGRGWPYPDHVEVYLRARGAATPSAPVTAPADPLEEFDLLDLDAPEPTGCYTDTSKR